MMPETLVRVRKTHKMTKQDPEKFDNKHMVAMVMAKVARQTFLYNSPLIISSISCKGTKNQFVYKAPSMQYIL